MKKIIAIAAFCVCVSAFGFSQEKILHYISPNNDGVKDEIAIPLSVSDKRYIQSWELRIVDESGNIVRTIGNKIAVPEKLNVKNFFKQLFSAKQGVDVPETVIWNGAMDNGETAPDGTYTYYAVATDDNGNTSRTPSYTVIVDTVSPQVTVETPTNMIFGEGEKSEFEIKQSGSHEDKWVAYIRSVDGKVVHSYEWHGEPLSFSWDGTNDEKSFVDDGVYSYEISSTDKAGNVALPAFIRNIIYSAEKPATNVFIAGSRYFSPGTGSRRSDVKLDISIPKPSSKANRLTEWYVDIVDETKKNVVKSYKGLNGENPPAQIVFDGRDEKNAILPDGMYQARVTAKYLNGFETAPIYSPYFILDTHGSDAKVSITDNIFGGSNKTSIEISQETSKKRLAPSGLWEGVIYSADDNERNKPIRSYLLGGDLPKTVVWDGFDDNGLLVADGNYVYELLSYDAAGNKSLAVTDKFALDTSNAQLLLSVREKAFSPNGDGVKDVESFTPVVQAGVGGVAGYTLSVIDEVGNVVRKLTGTNIPSSIQWDGKTDIGIVAADGKYRATLEVISANGSVASVTTQPFMLDNTAPSLVAKTKWSVFSPEETSSRQTVPVDISECTDEQVWIATVKDRNGKTVRHILWNGASDADSKTGFEWNAIDDSGNKVLDGVYKIELTSEDEAGNKFSVSLPDVTVDSREVRAFITREHEGISPNGDGYLEEQKFFIKTAVPDGIVSWQFDIHDENGKTIRSWKDDGSHIIPATIVWDGLDENGKAGEGTFISVLTASYEKGNDLRSICMPFVCSATPPELKVATAPTYFSPDNDGVDDDLFIKLKGNTKAAIKNWSFVIDDPNGNTFWQTEGKSQITDQITWDGLSNTQRDKDGMAERVASAMDYPYTFTVTDTLGMTSIYKGVIPIDVLVIMDGAVLKMAVPSIIFRSDNADFKVESAPGKGDGVTSAQAANNERVLKRVAEILNKFRDYKVTVVGHANRTTENPLEDTQDNPKWGRALKPLSLERANFVRAYLTRNGVSAARLSTDGKGATEPVADWKDANNRWKNRRVEFILKK